ncbi:MAG TPA: DUF4142 domain-containing protein [Sphingomonadaceae bacterium]|nr:DUF4142 domain-containing protein [Sphingomonadaceae bacterium]
MDRRTFAKTIAAGALGLGAAPVLAQGMRHGGMAMGPAERTHVLETLGIGSVSLLSSRMALSKARRPLVRQFADFEAEESTTVAQILGEISGMTPPPPIGADRALLARLQAANGAMFERDYLAGQLNGHQRLLRVQERYLSQGRNQHHRHIAMLARGRIREHIRELQLLQNMRG